MLTHMMEATNGFNWGKFLIGRFDHEWQAPSLISFPSVKGKGLLRQRGWSTEHLLVLDLETGEGAIFRPGGSAGADLKKRQIWVCPLYPAFLEWLYAQDLADLKALPRLVKLHNAEAAFARPRNKR